MDQQFNLPYLGLEAIMAFDGDTYGHDVLNDYDSILVNVCIF